MKSKIEKFYHWRETTEKRYLSGKEGKSFLYPILIQKDDGDLEILLAPVVDTIESRRVKATIQSKYFIRTANGFKGKRETSGEYLRRILIPISDEESGKEKVIKKLKNFEIVANLIEPDFLLLSPNERRVKAILYRANFYADRLLGMKGYFRSYRETLKYFFLTKSWAAPLEIIISINAQNEFSLILGKDVSGNLIKGALGTITKIKEIFLDKPAGRNKFTKTERDMRILNYRRSGMSSKEVAEIEGLDYATVDQITKRARKRTTI